MKLSSSVLISGLARAACKELSEALAIFFRASRPGLAVIQKSLHKMVIVEYPIARVPCQFLTFSPLTAGDVSKSTVV
jgi:hypothetical protein